MFGRIRGVGVALLVVCVRPARFGARLAIGGLLCAGVRARWYEQAQGESSRLVRIR
jgi:hypothetical protein